MSRDMVARNAAGAYLDYLLSLIYHLPSSWFARNVKRNYPHSRRLIRSNHPLPSSNRALAKLAPRTAYSIPHGPKQRHAIAPIRTNAKIASNLPLRTPQSTATAARIRRAFALSVAKRFSIPLVTS